MSARRRRAAVLLGGAFALSLLAIACDAGPDILTGIGEPLRVTGGQFIQGDLPGTPPGAGTASGTDAGPPPLTITAVTFNSTTILPGQANKSLGGSVTKDAIAVGASLAKLGTGYWVVPTGPVDPNDPNSVTFSLSASFDPNDPPGVRDLLVVGLGASGQAGQQNATPLCIEARIPDNGHACDPTQPLPNAVFTLEWDTNYDLDLHVHAPNGVDFNPRQPYGGPVDAGVHGIPPGLPRVDRDSLGSCVPDGLNQEDLVFDDPPPAGKYTVFVDPFASCGQPTVRFKFTLYRATGTCPACSQVAVTSVSGELLASQETGGTLVPLQIAQVSF
jgi:hypothetical protein